MLIQPKSAREFVGKWWGAEGLRWGPAGREGGSLPARLRAALAGSAQLGWPRRGPVVRVRTAERARRRESPAGPAPVSRPIRRFVPARAAGGPSASAPRAEGPR